MSDTKILMTLHRNTPGLHVCLSTLKKLQPRFSATLWFRGNSTQNHWKSLSFQTGVCVWGFPMQLLLTSYCYQKMENMELKYGIADWSLASISLDLRTLASHQEIFKLQSPCSICCLQHFFKLEVLWSFHLTQISSEFVSNHRINFIFLSMFSMWSTKNNTISGSE